MPSSISPMLHAFLLLEGKGVHLRIESFCVGRIYRYGLMGLKLEHIHNYPLGRNVYGIHVCSSLPITVRSCSALQQTR